MDAERFVLGSILLGHANIPDVFALLAADDFSLEKHRKIFLRMGELYERGDKIDHVTVAEELTKHGQLESVHGLSYLVSLDEGLPQIVNLDSYARIVKDRSTLRRTILACQGFIDRCFLAAEEPGEILREAEGVLLKLGDSSAKHGEWVSPGEVMQNYPGGFNAFMLPARNGLGIPTPWPDLTALLCGLQPGDLILVAGRPGMGKSVVMLQLALHAAMKEHTVAILSLEMTKESLIRRLVSTVGSVDAQAFRGGYLDAEGRARALHAASKLENLPLYIDDTMARTVPTVIQAVQRLAAKRSVEILFIDHLQKMTGIGRSENRNIELGQICHDLKHFAMQMKIPVVLLAQLNRECEIQKRRPQLSDLKETGTAEEDADVVLLIHREERYRPTDEALWGKAEFLIVKQRNGPEGKIQMLFQNSFQRFVEVQLR